MRARARMRVHFSGNPWSTNTMGAFAIAWTTKMNSARKFRSVNGWIFAALAGWVLLGATRASPEGILLVNAIVHTVSQGTITNGHVWIDGDKIVAVGGGMYSIL